MNTMHRITTMTAFTIATTMVGCQMYTPGGNPFFNGPNSAATWQSTEEFPKTVHTD